MLIHFPKRAALAALAVALLSYADTGAVPTDVVLRAAAARVVHGDWSVVADSSASGGSRLANRDAGAAKRSSPLASPSHYFEMTFSADAGTPYRLWLRGRAARDSYANDSVFVQFSGSVTSSGSPVWRIGTTSATEVNLEACSGCGLSGWGWQDNGWGQGVLGPLVYFGTSGTQTLRVQVREDGLSIDQIVLSPETYLSRAPGSEKNDTTILTDGSGTPPPSAASTLVREPYLQRVSDRSAVIVWASREPGPARARVAGRDVAAVTRHYPASATGMAFDYYQHEAAVAGLAPATTYAYDLFVGSTDVNPSADRFTTAPAPGSGRAQFIAFGDSGTGSTDQRALAAVMNADTFDFAMHTGDIAYGNSGGTGDATYATYHTWFFGIYRDWLRRRPFFPAPGNHDVRAGTSWGRAYLNLFVLPDHAGDGAYPDHAERYYSFDYGPVHFVSLDTEGAFVDLARRAEQLRWLEADLTSTPLLWRVAYLHRSPYSSGSEHGSDLAVRQAFGPLFEKYNVQIALSSHDHGYERSVPWRASADTSRQAVTYIVTGGGGGPLYPVGQNAWTAAAASRHHYVKVTIDGCDAAIAAIGKDGTAVDRHTLDGCGQWGDAAAPSVAFTSPGAAASVSGTVTVAATAWDDVSVEKVDLWIDGRLHAIDTTAPYAFAWDTRASGEGTHTLELRAYDIDGKRATRAQQVTVGGGVSAGAGEIVIRAAEVAAASVHGAWSFVADSTAAGGLRLWSAGRLPKQTASATPASYFDVSFDADAGVPYHLWVRMKADGNSYENDSVYFQFDKAVTAGGAPVARIGTTSAVSVVLEDGPGDGVHGWGWQDNRYDGFADHLYFSSGGTQRLRVQVREDGASIDQIVLSPGTYLTRAPGALKDDTTILPR